MPGSKRSKGSRRGRSTAERGRWWSRWAWTPPAATPKRRFAVTPGGFAAAGRMLADLGVPTVFVQEGGYDLDSIGSLVVQTLSGFESAT